ncbi:DMT family transporter [Cognatishimia activa]|uniref:Phosphonate utilization associated putative membrane protein n=1 Tax=Cognatishimia activa TaxID=1715691 RepID=A0A0P1ING2_9RHOB|nr:DMT family transporter [Cognatishimia activa]CUI26769.1 phosphonate utilization associated putative membrane protein [Cognatishimia activa]CUK25162.1 phosphonate utilization associated putative membrane protein [Cognatishimia activa]
MPVLNDNLRGALFMMGAMFAFTVNDTIIKWVGVNMSLPQLLAIRGTITTLILFVAAMSVGAFRQPIERRDAWLISARAACEVAAAYFFLTALLRMDLAIATAILLVLPLSVALCAALFFKEPLGWRRMLAILIGFCGMLLIVKPGPNGITVEAWLALAAVACVTARDLIARRITKKTHSLAPALAGAFGVGLSGYVAMAGQDWVPVSLPDMIALTGSAVMVGIAYACSVGAMRVGEVAFVVPFRYTSLVWALVLGYVVFGEWPDWLSLLGAGILVATGLFTIYRETQTRKAQPKAART